LHAQELLHCSQHHKTAWMKQQVGYNKADAAADVAYEQEIQDLIRNNELNSEQRGGQTIYIIPVVFHITHMGGPENISDAQVIDAVRILNEDYNKLNADTSFVVSAFANNIANVGFEFRLAQKDALGNCVSGITRTFTTNTENGDNATVDDVNKNLNGSTTNSNNLRFPRSKYLNIWVCKNLDGAAGYTYGVGGWVPSKYDGIWIRYDYVGSIGESTPVRSRALTHECGHWFNLDHVWGDTNDPGVSCGDDNVSDTPQTEGWTSCNLSGATCGSSLDNVQNYMEYSYCSRMFTNGQKARMIAAITSSTAQRSSLWTNTNITAAGVNSTAILCAADFSASNVIICEGESINFYDASYNGQTGWDWTFTGASPSASTDANPTSITYNTAGTYSVSLAVTSPNGSQNTTKTSYITVLPATGKATPFSEGFESGTLLPNTDWYQFNPDGGTAWQVVTGVGSSGNNCIKLNSSTMTAGNFDEFSSTTCNMTTFSSAIITFKYAFARKANSNTDVLEFYVSQDCGDTWVLRKTLSGSTFPTAANTTGSFTPSLAQWAQVDITNIPTSYLSANFRFKFVFTSGGGNNIYIDDINITGTVGVDENTNPYHFGVYPNPVDDIANVRFSLSQTENVSIELLDVVGRKAYSQQLGMISGSQNITFRRNDLPSGIYFVRLRVGEQVFIQRIVLQ
jgi:PKD repeat protein